MNVIFDFENSLYSIEQEIAKIPANIRGQSKTVISKASKIIKKNVEAELAKHKTDPGENLSNYDGTKPYIHMKDDVKSSVKDDKEGSVIAIIRGGKYTAYKWHLVNNGHLDRAGNNVPATHFIDNAMQKSESEVNAIIDEMLRKAVQ